MDPRVKPEDDKARGFMISIIGVGNFLMSDEGVGIHAVTNLREIKWPDGVEVLDGGTAGVALLHIIDGKDKVIIIDCADFGGHAGEIRVINPDDLVRDERAEISLHATDLLSVLEMAKSTITYPKKVIIIGIQPEKIEMGTTLSPGVEAAITKLPEVIRGCGFVKSHEK